MRWIRSLFPNVRRRHRLPIRVTTLEDRTLPATVFWAHNADGRWDEPSNWSTGLVPGSTDDVVIDRPGVNLTVEIPFLFETPRTIQSAETLRLIGGKLSGTVTLTDGAQVFVRSGLFEGLTINGTINVGESENGFSQLSIANGLTLNGTMTVQSFEGGSASSVAFTGDAQTVNGAGTIFLRGGSVLGTGSAPIVTVGSYEGGVTIASTVTIRADGASIETGFTQRFTPHGPFIADGLNGVMFGDGFDTGGGTVTLRADQGSYIGTGPYAKIMNSSGTVRFEGSGQIEIGSEIIGGTFTTAVDTTVTLGTNMSPTATTLDGVTLQGEFRGSSIGVSSGLNLQGTLHVPSGRIRFYDNAEGLTGTGKIFLGEDEYTELSHSSSAPITIESGITILAKSAVISGNSLAPLIVNGHFESIPGGQVNWFGQWQINNSININQSAMTLSGQGRIRGPIRSIQSNVNFEAEINNQGNDLIFDGSAESFLFQRYGKVIGGTLTGIGQSRLTIRQTTLDGVTLAIPTIMEEDVKIANGMTLNSTIDLTTTGKQRPIEINGTQSIQGTGIARNVSFIMLQPTTWTVGSNITLQNNYFEGRQDAKVVLNGRLINGQVGSQFIPVAFQNNGVVESRGEYPNVSFYPAPLNLSPEGTLTGGKWIVGDQSGIYFPGADFFAGTPAKNVKVNAAEIVLGEGGVIGSPEFNSFGQPLYDLVENRGSLTLASPMRLRGGFTQTDTGKLTLTISGDPASGSFGRIVAAGPVNVGGSLALDVVDNFVPSAGQSYDLLTGTSRTGQFSNVDVPSENFAIDYRPNAVRLGVTQTPADLSVTSVTAPAIVDAGQQAMLSYVVRNSGSPVTVGRRDEVYLSADGVLDASDLLLTRVERSSGVGAGADDRVSTVITIPAVVEGNYQVLVLADARRNVPDVNRGNNVLASAPSVVGVPLLTIGVPRSSGFTSVNQDRYFRVNGTPGKSIRLTVQSTANNGEMDLNALVGRLPGTNDPRVAPPQRSGPVGELVLPFTTDDTYFVVVSARNGAVATANFTITASFDVLAIDAVTPVLVGTGGPVTFSIHGRELGFDSIVRVLGPNGTSRTASRVETTGDRLFARVDMTGMPAGAYSVEVKRGSAISIQEDSFLAVDNMPGKLSLRMTTPFHSRLREDICIEFSNEGGTDITGHVIEVAAKNAAFLNNTGTGYGPTNPRFALIPDTEQGPIGIIPPGASGRIKLPFEFKGTFNDLLMEFEAHGYDLTNHPFEYNLFRDYPFPGYSPEQWANALDSLQPVLGPTWGTMMQAMTDRLETSNIVCYGPTDLAAPTKKSREIIKTARDGDPIKIKAAADKLKQDVKPDLDKIQKQKAALKQQISDMAERIRQAQVVGQTVIDAQQSLQKLCQALFALMGNGITKHPGASDVFGIDNPTPQQPQLSAESKALPLDPKPTTSGGSQDPPLIRRIPDQGGRKGRDVAVALRQLGNYNPEASRTFIVTNGQGGVISQDRYEGAARALKQKFPDANVFMADWSEGAEYADPIQAANNIPGTAKALAEMIRQKGIDPGKITYVSESFGGYVNDQTADILASGPQGKKADLIIAMNPANQNPLASPFASEENKKYIQEKTKKGFFKNAKNSVSTHTDSFADHNKPMGANSLRLLAPPGSDGIDKHVYGLEHFAETLLTGKNRLVEQNLDVPDGDRTKDEMDGVLRSDGTIIDTQKPTLIDTDYNGLPCDLSRTNGTVLLPADRKSPVFGKVQAVLSWDPNDKVGIAGDTPDGFIRDPQLFPYRVNFENTPDKATAPAQEVFITDVLDADLDPATFEFGDVGFGATSVPIPTGRQSFAVSVEAKNQNGTPLRVDISADFDRSTRTIRWTFRSVDPVTGTLPTGAFDGLLPVNDASGRGQGFVTYSVSARDDLTTGTQIANNASIVFDTNDAIVTNTVRYTVDRDAPSAMVDDLPAASPPSIRVNWSGSDIGSGIARYDVFVSTDGGPLVPWLARTTTTNGVFTGEVGRQYGFAAVAVDRVGNVQAPVTSPQTTTTVSATSPLLVGYREYAVGSGSGNHVRLTDPDDTTWLSFSPFSNAVRGVRTAAADFTGDGIADLVVGTGPGVPTRVTVYDGFFGDEIFSIAPFEPAFTGGVFVAAGDVNGDGIPDLAISPDEGGGPRVRLFEGWAFEQLADFFGIDDPAFRGGARASIGDLNGDGKGDLLVAAGFGGGPRVAAYDGAQLGSNGGPKLFGDFFAFEQSLRNGTFIAAGDVNGDGFADLVAGGGPGGGPRVYILDGQTLISSGSINPIGNFFAGDVNSRGGIRVTVKDLDGDAKADLVVGAGTGAGSRVTAYRGSQISLAGGTPLELFAFDTGVGALDGVFVG
jgi:hypothetical protein